MDPRDPLTLETATPLLRALVALHIASGRDASLADVQLAVGLPAHVRTLAEPVAEAPPGAPYVAVVVELEASRRKFAGCPCVKCRSALAMMADPVQPGYVRVWLCHENHHCRLDLPCDWFDGPVTTAPDPYFAPGDVCLAVPLPLLATFDRFELEIAAALLVRCCQVFGGWHPVLPREVGEVLQADVDAGREPFASIAGIPFLVPDVPGLVSKGWARWSDLPLAGLVEFTSAGFERLRRWVRQ